MFKSFYNCSSQKQADKNTYTNEKHYERFSVSIQPTVQSSSTTSAESQLESIKIDKEEKQTKGQSSFLILNWWPGNDGVNPEQTKANKPPDKLQSATETTSVKVNSEFNNQEGKTQKT